MVAKVRKFQKAPQGIARIDPKFGVQELTAKSCQYDGDIFLTMRSGNRMIAFSLTFEEFDDLVEVIEKLDTSTEADDSEDTLTAP
jgi:hypothetical protein